jgi:membrane protein DedA with SNARE-associated domain/rhodanese-related sulfurtransferase
MDWLAELVRAPGLTAVFLVALMENVGLPFPALPVLMLAGVLSHAGGISAAWAISGAALGAVVADIVWYQLGKWHGRRTLAALCRFSSNPDACMEGAAARFDRHRTASILGAKFIPGLNTVTPPLAGITAMPLPRFLLLDGAGCILWAGVGVGAGWLLGPAAIRSMKAINGALGWVIFLGILCSVAGIALSRYYLIRRYSVPRIPAGELHRMIERGEDVLVIDLRSEDSFAASAAMITSAIRVAPSGFHRVAGDLPSDRELVFYCTCNHDAATASLARTLIRSGRRRVKVLHGGFDAWEQAGLPTQPKPAVPAATIRPG